MSSKKKSEHLRFSELLKKVNNYISPGIKFVIYSHTLYIEKTTLYPNIYPTKNRVEIKTTPVEGVKTERQGWGFLKGIEFVIDQQNVLPDADNRIVKVRDAIDGWRLSEYIVARSVYMFLKEKSVSPKLFRIHLMRAKSSLAQYGGISHKIYDLGRTYGILINKGFSDSTIWKLPMEKWGRIKYAVHLHNYRELISEKFKIII